MSSEIVNVTGTVYKMCFVHHHGAASLLFMYTVAMTLVINGKQKAVKLVSVEKIMYSIAAKLVWT